MSDSLYQTYNFKGRNEQVCSIAAQNGAASHHILIIPPLFAEMNKLRRNMMAMARQLSAHNIQCSIADLPGTNESLSLLKNQDFTSWKAALESCADILDISHVIAFRGGALIDDIASAKPHLRINPVKGANIIKTMMRSKIIAQKEAGIEISFTELSNAAKKHGTELAGYHISAQMFADLQNSEPLPLTNVQEVRIGDEIEGEALWMRSEPGYDAHMAQSMADYIFAWCNQ